MRTTEPRSTRDLPLTARVVALRDVGGDVREIVLEPWPGGRLPAFEAGAHIDVRIRGNLVRQYSLLNDPGESDRYVIAVKRSPNPVTGPARDDESLTLGQQLEIGIPRNFFSLDLRSQEVLLVAGGIGLTPMLAMAHSLVRANSRFAFHICARSRDALPYADEFDRLPFGSRIRFHFDDGPAGEQLCDADLGSWSIGRSLYVCGPAGFMSAVITRAQSLGWPESSIHTESFSPSP
jgi:vanillate O-demethylase ferredoxin subunit